MSFILDALKRSESERQRRSAPGIADVPESLTPGNAPRWIWVLAVLLVINAAVLAGLWLKPGSDTAVAEAESAASAAAPRADSFSRMVSDARDAAAPPAEPVPAGSRSDATDAGSGTVSPPADPAPGDTADSAGTAGTEAVGTDGPSGTGSAPAASDAQATASASSAAAASPPGDAAPLASFDELRARGTLSLPDLHLDIHVYSEKPGDRFVFVNMNKYREQGKLEEGPLVKEISPDGVVLEHQGREFLLPRE